MDVPSRFPGMRAMVLRELRQPLQLEYMPVPEPAAGQIQIRVEACGVCRTDLHLVDGELSDYRLPIIPGHEIVGRITAIGAGVQDFELNERVGVPWLGWTCGTCEFCARGQENLCEQAQFTGCHIHGGYAEYTVADARYCFSHGLEFLQAARAAGVTTTTTAFPLENANEALEALRAGALNGAAVLTTA